MIDIEATFSENKQKFQQAKNWVESIDLLDNPEQVKQMLNIEKHAFVYANALDVLNVNALDFTNSEHQKYLVYGLESTKNPNEWAIASLSQSDVAVMANMLDAKRLAENRALDMEIAYHQYVVGGTLFAASIGANFAKLTPWAGVALTLLLCAGEKVNDAYIGQLSQQKDASMSKEQFLQMHRNQIFSNQKSESISLPIGIDKAIDISREQERQALLREIKAMITQNNGQALKNAITQEQATAITQQLQQTGLVSGLLLSKLNDMSRYIEVQEIERLQQAKLQYTMAQYQGLQDACQFAATLAGFIQCEPLAVTAHLAHNTVNIGYAIQQIFASGSMGFATLSPFSTIGMAVLKIFSLFNKNKNPDLNQIILKQLHIISKQVHQLREELQKTKRDILYRLDYYFDTLFKALDHFNHTLTIPVLRSLSDISGDIQILCDMTDNGFKAVLLKDLRQAINDIDNISNGISSINAVTQKQFEKNLNLLSQYAKEEASNHIVTGAIYENAITHHERLHKILNKTLSNSGMDVIGLMFVYAKEILKLDDIQQYNIKSIIHPEVWLQAVSAYLQLQTLFLDKYQFDTAGVILSQFQKQIDFMLKIINAFQTSEKLYMQLFGQLQLATNEIVSAVTQRLQNYKLQHHQDITTGFNDMLSSCNMQVSAYPQYHEYNIPNGLEIKPPDRDFFKLENIQQLLRDLKKHIPSELLLAEKIGLGHFTYHFRAPDGDAFKKRHHKSEEHGKKFVLNANAVAGLEITFHYQGRNYPVYSATSLSKQPHMQRHKHSQAKKHFFGNLRTAYRFMIVHGTKSVCDAQFCEMMKTSLQDELLKEKKALALDIINTIKPACLKLLVHTDWICNYLTIAGFMNDTVQVSLQALNNQIVTLQNAYDHYQLNATLETPFPVLPNIDFNGVQTALLNALHKANTLPTSAAIQYLEKGKQLIYEFQFKKELGKSTLTNATYAENQTHTMFGQKLAIQEKGDVKKAFTP